jgi:hypothetical protein
MLNGMDDSTNDFLDEPKTVVEPYLSLADTAALWRAQLATRPTVNLRPRVGVEAQAETQRLGLVLP